MEARLIPLEPKIRKHDFKQDAHVCTEMEIVGKIFQSLNSGSLSKIESYWMLDMLQDCMDNSFLTQEAEEEYNSLLKIFGSDKVAA